MTREREWIGVARPSIGRQEIPGPRSSAFIAALWRGVEWIHGGHADTDLTPWCGAWCRWVVTETNAQHPLLMLPAAPPRGDGTDVQ